MFYVSRNKAMASLNDRLLLERIIRSVGISFFETMVKTKILKTHIFVDIEEQSHIRDIMIFGNANAALYGIINTKEELDDDSYILTLRMKGTDVLSSKFTNDEIQTLLV